MSPAIKNTNIYLLEIPFTTNGKADTLWPVIIQHGQEYILVDCGYPGQLELLEKAAREQGIDLQYLTGLILTHHDIDHVGAAAELKQKYPNIQVMAPVIEAPYISGKRKSLRLIQAEASLKYLNEEQKPFALQFIKFLQSVVPVQVDKKLQMSDTLWSTIQVVPTPGHTPGHISLYIPSQKILIAADAIVVENNKLNIANPQYCLDLEQAVHSVALLSQYEIAELICYHGGRFRGDIQEAFKQVLHEYNNVMKTPINL